MKILMTGASGQLGHKISKYLLENGFEVVSLGRKSLGIEIQNYSWSLGMSPNPQAFVGIDCVLHLAWSTFDRGDLDYHLNVGGSAKVIEASSLSRTKIINFSSLSASNPISNYGRAKKHVEDASFDGINLRIAKLEESFPKNGLNRLQRIWRKMVFIPVPRDLSIQVIEVDELLKGIADYIEGSIIPGIYLLPYQSYEFGDYLERYHGLRSFTVPKVLVNIFFVCFNYTRTRTGKLWYDRWLSLVSTDQVLRKLEQPF